MPRDPEGGAGIPHCCADLAVCATPLQARELHFPAALRAADWAHFTGATSQMRKSTPTDDEKVAGPLKFHTDRIPQPGQSNLQRTCTDMLQTAHRALLDCVQGYAKQAA
jgi:hypothetical protein